MNGPDMNDWTEANQQLLAAELACLKCRLTNADEAAQQAAETVCAALAARMASPPAIDVVTQTFGLSVFERSVLLLAAGVELDADLLRLCNAHDARGPTFGLALASLDRAHWSALTPVRPLRRWRLVDVDASQSLTAAPLRIDERVLHFLAGINVLDVRLQPLLRQRAPPQLIAASHAELAQRLLGEWSAAASRKPLQLVGDDADGAEDVAATLAAELGVLLEIVRAEDLPHGAAELETCATLLERELALLPALLLLCVGSDTPAVAREAVQSLCERLDAAPLIAVREALPLRRAHLVRDVHKPAAAEQRRLWQQALAADDDADAARRAQFDGALDTVATQFRLSAQAIVIAADAVRDGLAHGAAPGRALWSACRVSARNRLDELAQHIRAEIAWEDLVLPPVALHTLREIAAHVRARGRVYEEWGFGQRSARGLGISALFAGESGTGKTLAAEVLACELNLDLYRIDLAAVVSKYIGETEKNLRRVFDAADDSGAILLFDEADALFGKRSEVKDSHDRYANIEVSYLLQRIEAYRGLAILTTNLKSALDQAFQRRLRFVVQFPFPDRAQREAIWQRVFPRATPTRGLDLGKLARLHVSGGGIRNIAVNAAFSAADGHDAVTMAHLLEAARAESAKQDKPLNAHDTRDWI